MSEPMPPCELGCGQHPASFHFRIPAQADSIAPLIEMVLDFACHELSPGKDMDVAVALQEALANAIVHGSRSDPSKMVDCWVARSHSGLLIMVRDSGPGFDLQAIGNPLAPQNLGADHGRGIHMIQQLMDEVHFARNGAEIHMQKR